ncbi:MAG: hypothetical protein KF851_16785 [Pirellulaceae bacterium]|nr:hypothetical protein [Pirellulaceae bacterium]
MSAKQISSARRWFRRIAISILVVAFLHSYLFWQYHVVFPQLATCDVVIIENCRVLPEERRWKACVFNGDAKKLMESVISNSVIMDFSEAGFATYSLECIKDGRVVGRVLLYCRDGGKASMTYQLVDLIEHLSASTIDCEDNVKNISFTHDERQNVKVWQRLIISQ